MIIFNNNNNNDSDNDNNNSYATGVGKVESSAYHREPNPPESGVAHFGKCQQPFWHSSQGYSGVPMATEAEEEVTIK